MSNTNFALSADDDLPRTLRRAREDKEREARSRDPSLDPTPGSAAARAPAQPFVTAANGEGRSVVVGFDVPFLRLVGFFIKAAFAAIPAVILFFLLVYGMGQLLLRVAPELVQMKVDISVYKPQAKK